MTTTHYQYTVRRNGAYICALPSTNLAIEKFIRNNVIPPTALEASTDDLGYEHFGVKSFPTHLSFTELLIEAGSLGYTFEKESIQS